VLVVVLMVVLVAVMAFGCSPYAFLGLSVGIGVVWCCSSSGDAG